MDMNHQQRTEYIVKCQQNGVMTLKMRINAQSGLRPATLDEREQIITSQQQALYRRCDGEAFFGSVQQP